MSEENEPLIHVDEGRASHEQGGSIRVRSYGTSEGSYAKIVPHEDRITYSWSEINVFASERSRGKKSFLRFGSGDKQVQDHKKHILKNAPARIYPEHILISVHGIAYPGELLAILGSSGAGKTTLLNALTFRSPTNVAVTGVRCVNGVPVNSGSLTTQSAYVQQDDLFIGSLTVREHLIFQALVRMDKDIPYSQRIKRVDEVITEIALTKCQDTRIGTPGKTKGISGGEMKRLSFASEVLSNPSLMFCDEPTSGLDSFTALSVVQVLKGMAQAGRTVISTIHQPSSELYAMFDKLLLMAEGRVAFLGTPDEADVFFKSLDAPCPKNYNPADYYIQLLAVVPGEEEASKNAIGMICDGFSKSEMGVKVLVESATLAKGDVGYDFWLSGDLYSNPYKASWCSQFRAVLWRSWLTVMKEPLIIKVRVFQTIVVSLLISALYYGQRLNADGVMNINGALFIFLTNMTFQNIFAVISVFSSELHIFLREHRNGMYRTDVYFLCKTMAELPIFTFLPIIFTCINYYLIGLNPDVNRFLITCGILVLVSNVATSFGYMISCASTSESMALSVGPPLTIPFLLFGGFFLNISSIPSYLKWLASLSWFRYGNEALLINQWEGVNSIDCTNTNGTCPANGRIVLEVFNFDESDFIMDIIYLVALICFFRLLAFLALLSKTYRTE